MKIDLPIQRYASWEIVSAEIVDIAPHLPGTFAVHKYDDWGRPQWRVSHVETGAYVAIGKTRLLALLAAKKITDKASPQKYRAVVRKQVKEYRRMFGIDLSA